MADEPRPTTTTPPRAPSSAHEDTVPAPELSGELPRAAGERYRFGSELGRGGMGRVVEAYDTQLGRTVALKEALPRQGPSIVRRFRREIEITARLEHAAIVPLYDAGTLSDGRPYYVMRRVTGRPLDELIARASGLSERLALLPNLLAAIDAIAHAHRRGVIHRDLKPANILVGELGETVVIDWGLAKVIGEDDPQIVDPLVPSAADSLKTQAGSVFGTPGFMAPEQARGEDLGPRSDVYALGATLYQLLVGKPPVRGDSATGMIESTLRHAIVPVEEACPEAPPELVAIADKALAADPAGRYENAAALGEDVRRFATGQLVAAHRYTRRQRLARFARRHRAVLVVAAAATVVVAVLAWISVARILSARDAANEARAIAEARTVEAVQARDKLASQYDALLIEKARSLLDKNPTQALALLAQLPAGTSRLAEGRAIAKAAVVRGVAWAMPTPDAFALSAQISLDTSRAAALLSDGSVAVWDLDRRKQLLHRSADFATQIRWVSGNRLLAWRTGAAPALLDPATGARTPLTLPSLDLADVSDDGERIAFIDAGHQAGVAELATGATRVLSTGPAEDVAIAPGGGWIAVVSRDRVTVLDPAGRELAHRDGSFVTAVFSRTHVAALYNDRAGTRVYALELANPAAGWIEVPTGGHGRVVHIFFWGAALQMLEGGWLASWRPDGTTRQRELPFYSAPAVDDARDGVLVTNDSGGLRYYAAASSGELALPGPADHVRLLGRRGHSRLVALAPGAMYVYDLDAFVPRAVQEPAVAAAAFVDPRQLLSLSAITHEWVFDDIEAGVRAVAKSFPPVLMLGAALEVADGDVAMTVPEAITHLIWLRARAKQLRTVAEGPMVWGRPIAGDAIAWTTGDNRIHTIVGSGQPKELATLDGRVTSICSLGRLELAAISARGELIRASLATGKVERTHVDVREPPSVQADLRGRIVIASGPRISLWDGGVREVAKLAQPIRYLIPVEGGMIAVLESRQVQLVQMTAGAAPAVVLPAMAAGPIASATGRELAAVGVGGEVTVVDLPGIARWTLPIRYSADKDVFGFSPDGKLFQASETAIQLWTLPDPGVDLAAWIDEQTNARVSPEGVLVWPWQSGSPPG